MPEAFITQNLRYDLERLEIFGDEMAETNMLIFGLNTAQKNIWKTGTQI